jgi:hypothetical protein
LLIIAGSTARGLARLRGHRLQSDGDVKTAVKRWPNEKDADSANIKYKKSSHDMIKCPRVAETILKSCGMTVELSCVYHVRDCNKERRSVWLVQLLSS